jgi:hypothetical protein
MDFESLNGTPHIEEQICLQEIKGRFNFVFSLKPEHVYTNSLSQNIDFG